MPSSRDVGGRDFENTVTTPGPLIRSRHPDTEHVDQDRKEMEGTVDEVRCPTCGEQFPGIAVACPNDGTDLTAVSDGPTTPRAAD